MRRMIGLALVALFLVGCGLGNADPYSQATDSVQDQAIDSFKETNDTITGDVVAETPTLQVIAQPDESQSHDYLPSWYGFYFGKATGTSYSDNPITDYTVYSFENEDIFIGIVAEDECDSDHPSPFPVCVDDDPWVLTEGHGSCGSRQAFWFIKLYLPEDRDNVSGLIYTDSKLTFSPIEGQPYEMVIERINGQIEGYFSSDWHDWGLGGHRHGIHPNAGTVKLLLDEFVADRVTIEELCNPQSTSD